MMLSVVGLSHKSAPLEVREQVALSVAEYAPLLSQLRESPAVDEAALLSTCNRTEVVLVTPGDPPVANVIRLLCARRDVAPEAVAPFLAVHRNLDAARYVMRIAAGLESMVVGEQQVLRQVRQAFEAARAAGATGPTLNRLLQIAIAGGRRVRRDTALARRAASIPHAALAVSRRLLGPLRGRTALIVGAGEMAGLVAKVFAGDGVRIVAVANRTLRTAQLLASRYDAEALALDDVGKISADILIVSVGASEPVVTHSSLCAEGTRATPRLVIDLGVPRGVEPEVARLPGLTLHDIDDLLPAGTPTTASADDVAAAERITERSLSVFARWLASRTAVPLIAALYARAEQIVDAELLRARSRLRDLDEDQRQAVRDVVEAAMHKLLHSPFVRLRASAQKDDPQVLALARELFDLEDANGAQR